MPLVHSVALKVENKALKVVESTAEHTSYKNAAFGWRGMKRVPVNLIVVKLNGLQLSLNKTVF